MMTLQCPVTLVISPRASTDGTHITPQSVIIFVCARMISRCYTQQGPDQKACFLFFLGGGGRMHKNFITWINCISICPVY
uniref:BPTI/Kunitz inhibitor domain-containing protein n=1 Tax=Anguilla anguilla TaxID=7936 RepID=A0A0E9QR65_ANGAN